MSRLVSASSSKRRSNSSLLHDRKFILTDQTPFAIKEEYKTLRTNVMFSIPTKECKVVGVSSSQPMEGKSINCLNLAIAFAQTKARVLLIDCDLRLPKQSGLVALNAIPGVSNVLIGMNQVDEAIQKTGFYGLDVMLSGEIPPNPSELLGSESMENLIKQLKTRYDYIFIDLPPINIVADASIVSKYFSGLILIVRADVSKREGVLHAINQLELTGANIIGIVLNGVKSKSGSGSRYGKYGKYGKYGDKYGYGSNRYEHAEKKAPTK